VERICWNWDRRSSSIWAVEEKPFRNAKSTRSFLS